MIQNLIQIFNLVCLAVLVGCGILRFLYRERKVTVIKIEMVIAVMQLYLLPMLWIDEFGALDEYILPFLVFLVGVPFYNFAKYMWKKKRGE